MAGSTPIAAATFTPPHCPNKDCPNHSLNVGWRWQRYGSFQRASDGRHVPRFLCLSCRRTFSTQSFSVTYWLKRPDLFVNNVELVVVSACLRQIARYTRTTHPTVARHLARAGRQCMLFHHNRLRTLAVTEPVIVDGLETFEHSQFFPNAFHVAVGADSWFTYHFTDSPLRRSGRMTAEQKLRRAELESVLGRPDPKAVERDVAQLLRVVHDKVPPGHCLELRTDDHRAYPRSLRRLKLPPERVVHRTTPSTDPRIRANALFAVNLADLLVRHACADHKRETIAFAKRRQAAAERLVVHLVWRNYVKKRRENAKSPDTAAMAAGAATSGLSFADILDRRRFPRHYQLPPRWRTYYRRGVRTVVYRRQSEHALRYAF